MAVSQAAINDFIKARPKCNVAIGYCAESMKEFKQQHGKQGATIEVDPHLPGEPVVALELCGTTTAEPALRSVRAFIHLRKLNLTGMDISDEAAVHLYQLSRLR